MIKSLASVVYGFPVKKEVLYYTDQETGNEIDWVEAWEISTNKKHHSQGKVDINVPTNAGIQIFYLYHNESVITTQDYVLKEIPTISEKILSKWKNEIREFCRILEIKYDNPRWLFTANFI